MKLGDWQRTFREDFMDFFLAPMVPTPLALLRTGLGLLLLVQAYFLRFSVFDFFSSAGYIQGGLAQILNNPTLPQISWLRQLLAPWQVSEATCIVLVCSLYLLSLLAFTAGYWIRGATVLVWFFHWVLVNTASSSSYGVDQYVHIFLFYLIWAPSAWTAPPSSAARLLYRTMQLHLCISYLASGIEKAQGIQWWNGELLWRVMSLPIYRQFDMSWLAHWPAVSMLAGWMTLVLELGYCVFIWPRQTRKLWLMGIVGMHLGIAVFLGLHLFGFVMALLNLALFAPVEQGLKVAKSAAVFHFLQLLLGRRGWGRGSHHS